MAQTTETLPLWLEIAKPLVSTLVGAVIAFWATRRHDAVKRYRESIAAGNLALIVLKVQLNEFLLFRKNLYQDFAAPERDPNSPLWLMARPSFMTYVGEKINFESLGFLLEKPKYGKLFDELHLSQICYADLIRLDEFRNETMIEIQREIAKATDNTFENIQAAVGPYLIATAESIIPGLAKRARDDEKIYHDAFKNLRAALENELDVWWRRFFRRFGAKRFLGRKPTIINMESPLQGFRIEDLPNPPRIIIEALENRIAAANL